MPQTRGFFGPNTCPLILAVHSRIVSKHWFNVANHKRTPHDHGAIECSASNREVNARIRSTEIDDATLARHAASFCRDGIDRQRTLELLDAEIKAFNDLIAAQCSG